MAGKISNVITLLLIAAMSALLALSNARPRLAGLFWVAALVFIGHLVLSVRRQRRLARQAARLAALPGHFLIDAPCLLDREAFAVHLDPHAKLLLQGLLNAPEGPCAAGVAALAAEAGRAPTGLPPHRAGLQDCRVLKPGLERLIRRLKRAARRFPHDPGPPALRAWCLALLCRLNRRAEPGEEISAAAEERMFRKAVRLYAQAEALAPENGRIAADWGRALEQRADDVDEPFRQPCLEAALERYQAADLPEAWRGQGRVLYLLALESTVAEARELLARSVECFERARRDSSWGGDFYLEFSAAVQSLAKLHEDAQHLSYCHHAARLAILATEKDEQSPLPWFAAGQALYRAGLAEDDPEKAGDLLWQAVDSLEKSAELNHGQDPQTALLTARSLADLAKLPASRETAPYTLERAAECCAQASALDSESEEIWAEWANVLGLAAEHNPDRAEDLWAEAAQKYREALTRAEASPDRTAVNLHNLAYTLVCLAELKPAPPKARQLLRSAARKYERAAGLNNENLVTLKNWGDVLGYQAELADDPAEAARLYDEAARKYERAAELYPDQAGPWRRWSALLEERARAERTPGRRRALWQSSLDKLERGVQAEPDDAETWVMWGRLLGELFWEGPEYEHPLLVAGAIEKFERALSLNPDDDQVWSLLGRIRLAGAELPPEVAVGGGPLTIALAAVDNFKRACALNPNLAEHWAEWGRACFRASLLMENEAAALAALREATEKYTTASALEPENVGHHSGLGHVLYQWGWRLEEPEPKREKFQQAYHHCGEAGRLDPQDPTVWRNWAKVAEALAALEKDPHISFNWQNEADEKHYHADVLEAPSARRH
ncbi:MAG: hypothetical protein LBV79_08895 [Candidatus Adiutrix sp.]|jgi:cytochrome c-type biogenesis protein CcmH/NrfG|nr:hypothetical protein [Candidatus Adiutrix sp.]